MIVYFSGTGNSKYVAQRIAEAIGDRSESIEGLNPDITLTDGEVFGIVTPTHWWELPFLTRQFLERLTLVGADYTFLVATYGTTPGCCGEDARRILKRRGIRLSASFGVRMPDTWTPMFDLTDIAKVSRINEESEKYIDHAIERIQQRVSGNHTSPRLPYVFRIFTDPLLNSERRTKNFYVEEQCIGCGLCARKCPVQAIEIRDKKPVWVKKECALCFRCLHHCPKFAIQYGNGKTKLHGQYRNPHVKV